MKINKSFKGETVPAQLSRLPKTTMRVTFQMEDKEFELNLQQLLLLNIDAKNIPDAQIDRILQDIVVYRITLTSALEQLVTRTEDMENKFKHWRAVQFSSGYDELICVYERQAGKSMSASRLAGISRQQVEDWLQAQVGYSKHYRLWRKKIRACQEQHGVIKGVLESINAWSFALLNIANRRESVRRGHG